MVTMREGLAGMEHGEAGKFVSIRKLSVPRNNPAPPRLQYLAEVYACLDPEILRALGSDHPPSRLAELDERRP